MEIPFKFILFPHLLLLLLFILDNIHSIAQSPSPSYFEESLHFSIEEESPSPTVISVIPPEIPGFSNWRLAASNPLLSFNPNTSELLTNGRIDREILPNEPESGKCFLRAILLSQGQNGTRLIRINVEILDLNDNAPILANNGQNEITLPIIESASVGSRFWLGTARDADFGENGTIGGFGLEFEEKEAEKLFRPEKGENGELSLELMGKLDREKRQIYKGKMRIWDEGRPKMERKMPLEIRILDANDNAPKFEQQKYELILPMKRPFMVKANDPDEGVNGQIRYRIVDNNQMGLKIDEESGLLNWNGKQICPPPNLSKCTFFVEAWDQGQPSLSGRAQINVEQIGEEENMEKKKFTTKIRNLPNGQPFAVFDENAQNGSVLAILSVETEGEGKSGEIEGKMHFEIGGEGSEKFRIEKIGRIGLVRLNGGNEGKKEWNLRIFTHFDGAREERNIRIFMRPPNDSAPILSFPIQRVIFPENAPIGTLLARIEVKNAQNNEIKFKLVETDEWAEYVEVHPIAGLLRLRKSFPKLGPGIAKSEFTVQVDLSNPPPSLAKSRAQIQIEIFDVNDNSPKFLDCPLAPSICIFSVTISENHPLENPLLSPKFGDDDAGQNARIHFSLLPFDSDNPTEDLPFRVDQEGKIFLIRHPNSSLNLHRFWLKIEDNGEPKKSSEALIEVSIKEMNNEAPSFPAPSKSFLSLRYSQPSHSKIFQAQAFDPDLEDQFKGLRYALLDSPIVGLFELDLSNGWLTLAKPLANSDLAIGQQFALKIGAIDQSNRTSPNPLELNIRIVADSAKVPPAFGDGIIPIPTIRHFHQNQCLEEEEFLREIGGFFDGQMILNISSLDNSTANFNFSNSSICFKFPSISPSHSPIPFLIDFGQNGWALALFEQKMPSECGPDQLLQFLNPPHQIGIQIPGTPIGHHLHRFRLKNPPKYCQKLENVEFELAEIPDSKGMMPLVIDPKEGFLQFIGWPNEGQNIRHFVATLRGPNSTKTIHPFLLVFEPNEFVKIPPFHSIFIPNFDGHLRPGDLLAKIGNEFNLPEGQFHFALPNQGDSLLSDWSQNSNNENLIELFPDGELRIGGKMPATGGMVEWKKEIQIGWKWNGGEFLVHQKVYFSVYIQNSPNSPSSALKCPEIVQKFVWHADSPPGTVLGKLARQNCRICRIKLIGPENGLFVEEGSGKLMTRQMNAGGGNIEIGYGLEELGKNEVEEIECKAKVEIGGEKAGKGGGNKIGKIFRKKLDYLDAAKKAEAGLALADFGQEFGKGKINHFMGQDGENFEIRNDDELFWKGNSTHFRPFYLLEGINEEGEMLEIRLQISAPFFKAFELKSSSGPNISISFSAAKIGSILSQISVHPSAPEFAEFFENSNFSIKFKIQKIEPNDGEGIFGICPNSGRIFLQQNLESKKTFLIEIEAEEEWSKARGKIELKIEKNGNENGENGGGEMGIYKFELMENAEMGQIIGQLGGKNWKIVDEKAGELPFSIDSNKGILRVNGKIDAEENAFYSFRIGDGNEGEWRKVEMLILDQNEHSPALLNHPNGPIYVVENAEIGSKIFKLELADADLMGNLFAEIDQFWADSGELFFIDSEGWIRLGNELDREKVEKHKLRLNICDGRAFKDNNVLCSSTTLELVVLDVNDNAPQFLPTNQFQFVLEENSPIGTVFGTLRAEDPDLGQNGSIHFRIWPPNAKVGVDPVFGYLKVNAKIDKEQIGGGEMDLGVQAFDGGMPQMVAEAQIRVKILDEDDNAPELERHELSISLDENAPPEMVLARLGCKDPDEGANGLCLFRIEGDGHQQFRLGRASGLLKLAHSLMESARREYFQLNISVSPFSGKWPSKPMKVTINVVPSNRPPYFGPNQQIPILIQQNSTKIHLPMFLRRIQAIDPDSGQNGSISYSILEGQSAYFALNPQNGELNLIGQIDAGDFHLQILASDRGHPPLSATLDLLVRIFGPKNGQIPLRIIPPIHSVHLVEMSPTKEIIRLKAIPKKEKDQIPPIRFHFAKIICEDGILGENSKIWANLFQLDQIEGRLSLLAPLDAESCKLWRIEIRAEAIMENGNEYFGDDLDEGRAKILIWVDKMENQTKKEGKIKIGIGGPDVFIPWTAKPGDPILAFDAPNSVFLFGEDSHQFTVDARGLLKLAKELPRGRRAEFALQMGMKREGQGDIALRIYTAEAEHFPKFPRNSTNSIILPPRPNPLIPLAKLNAHFPAKNHSSAQIFYSIAAGDHFEQFRIDPFDGHIYWFPPKNGHFPLPEQIQIGATSAFGPYSSIHSLKIIPNSNAFPTPLLPLECIFEEGGMPYLRVEWPENEMGNNGALAKVGVKNAKGPFEFELISVGFGEYFGIDRSTGIVHLAKELDRELAERIRLEIVVKSKNNFGRGKCILEVEVGDKNDNPPRFGHILNLLLNESTPFPSKIFQIEVKDADTPENARNLFTLMEGGQNDGTFRLEENGELILTRKLDFEKKSEYRLSILAQDGEWQMQSAMHIGIVRGERDLGGGKAIVASPMDFWLENEKQNENEQKIGKMEIGNGNDGFEEEWIWTEPGNGNIFADFGLAQILGANLEEEPIVVNSNFGQQIRIHLRKNAANLTELKMENKSRKLEFKFKWNLNAVEEMNWPKMRKIRVKSMPKKGEEIGRIFIWENGVEIEKEWDLEIKGEKMIGMRRGEKGEGAILEWRMGGECAKSEGVLALKVEAKNGKIGGKGDILEKAMLISIPPAPMPNSVPQFLHPILHLRISRHSPPSTIIGKFNFNAELASMNNFAILMDQRADGLIRIDQSRGEIILRRNIGKEDQILQAFSAILMAKDGKFRSESCLVRILILDNLEPLPIFPFKIYNVQIDDFLWKNGTMEEMVAFDFNLPKGAKLGIEEEGNGGEKPFPSNLFCIRQNVPPALCLCQSPKNISHLLRQYSFHYFHLNLAIFDQFGQIRSRAIVHLEFKSPQKMASPLHFHVGFVPENASPGQNVLRMPIGDGHWTFLETEMEKFFRLNSSTGIISTISSIPGGQFYFPIEFGHQSGRQLFLIFVDKMQEEQEKLRQMEIWIPQFEGILGEKEIWIENLEEEKCEMEEWKKMGGGKGAKIWTNCTFWVDLEENGQNGVENIQINLQKWTIGEWRELVRIGGIGTQKSMAKLMREIANSVPDLSILLPIALKGGQSPQKGFPNLRQFLFAFRDPNGQILPANETFAILEHFAHKNSEKLHSNVFHFEVQKMPEGICANEGEERECLGALRKCLGGGRRRIWVETAKIGWGPMEVESSCLFSPSIDQNAAFECAQKRPFAPAPQFIPAFSFSHFSSIQIFDAFNQFQIHQISIQFATRKPRALLIYWPMEGRKFISVDLVNGKIRMNFFGNSLESILLGETVNDGNWRELDIWFGPRQIQIGLGQCESNGGKCHFCAKFAECHLKMPTKQLQNWKISSFPLFLGGLPPDRPPTPPGTMSAMAFLGCIRQIRINEFDLAQELEFVHPQLKITFNGISPPNSQCALFEGLSKGCQSEEANAACQGGICVPNEGQGEGEGAFSCICTQIGGFEAANCSDASLAVHFPPAPAHPIQLKLTPFARRQLSFIPLAGNLVHNFNLAPKMDEMIPCESEGTEEGKAAEEFTKTGIQWMEMDFSGIGRGRRVLMCARQMDGNLAAIEVDDEGVEYSLNGPGGNFKLNLEANILDGKWHRIGMEICPNGKMIRLKLNQNAEKGAKNARISFFPQPMSPKLDSFWLGQCPSQNAKNTQNGFCLRRLLINNQLQPISGHFAKMASHRQFFQIILTPKNAAEYSNFECTGDCPFDCPQNAINLLSSNRLATMLALILLPILAILFLAFLWIRRGKMNKIGEKRKCQVAVVESTKSNGGGISNGGDGGNSANWGESEYSTIKEDAGANKVNSPCTSFAISTPTIKNSAHRNSAIICSSSDFSSAASNCLGEGGGMGPRGMLDLLMAEDNSNFYQDVLLDWSHTKNYENWPQSHSKGESEENDGNGRNADEF